MPLLFKIFEDNEETAPALFLTPKSHKNSVSQFNAKLRSKSDSSTPYGLMNISKENSGSCFTASAKLLTQVRTPLQPLNCNVSKSARILSETFNVSKRQNIQRVNTPEIFVIHCDSDSNEDNNWNEIENQPCTNVVTPILKVNRRLGTSFMSKLAENNFSVNNKHDLKPMCDSDYCFTTPNRLGADNTENNCGISSEVFDTTDELPSPEIIGSPFWSEEKLSGMWDNSVIVTINEMIESTSIRNHVDKVETSLSPCARSPDIFTQDSEFSEDFLSAMLGPPEIHLAINSPEEIPFPYD